MTYTFENFPHSSKGKYFRNKTHKDKIEFDWFDRIDRKFYFIG